jgi:MoaA/NifB/PqqE/SkfB family radical SAM enzyme
MTTTIAGPRFFVRDVALPALALRDPEATLRLGAALAGAAALRARRAQDESLAIPSTLLIAVNSHCNLRCPTCTVADTVALPDHHLSQAVLRAIIGQALALGIANFVLLGGEPLLYPGLEEVIAAHPAALFNVFSNGRLLDDDRAGRFAPLPNLALYLNVGSTNRRGPVDRLDRGVLRALAVAQRHRLFHGAAVTISADNAPLFAERATLESLRGAGSRFALFLDYLPAVGIPQDRFSTPPELRAAVVANARAFAAERSFFCRLVPEDEALFGGCMAAGREILCVSAYGTIDPCPFVPFSNLRFPDTTLLEALRSPFMSEMRDASRDWEMRGGACAVRAAAGEFQSLAAEHAVLPNTVHRRDTPLVALGRGPVRAA